MLPFAIDAVIQRWTFSRLRESSAAHVGQRELSPMSRLRNHDTSNELGNRNVTKNYMAIARHMPDDRIVAHQKIYQYAIVYNRHRLWSGIVPTILEIHHLLNYSSFVWSRILHPSKNA
jgi:hypothetical protein